jgi:selenocysteine-specific elongation factor
MIVATAGHIDHGKTVLVKALTGIDTDRLPEEKKRGMSIDIGFAYQPLADGEVLGFVDVPGHERFVRNMLAGVTGIDFALLIVAADDGPMPQTLEHLAILDLLGVSRGAVALTKIDRVEPGRIAEVDGEIRALVGRTCLADAEIFPVSGLTGAGIEALRARLDQAAHEHLMRSSGGNFRLAVDRSFTVAGAGQVVTGAVFSGEVRPGDQLMLSPEGVEVRVRGLHAQNREAQIGRVGQRCAVNIAGPDLKNAEIHRGSWLLTRALHDPVPRFDARIRVLAGEIKPLKHWTPVHVHLGAEEAPGRVALLDAKEIAPGGEALAQIVLDRRIGVLRGDRLILRDTSARRTVAGGWVVDPFAPARGRAKPERLAFLAAMERQDPADALTALLEAEPAGVDLRRFAVAWNLTEADRDALFELVPMARVGRAPVSLGFAPAAWEAIQAETLAALKSWHETSPDRPGPAENILRAGLQRRIPAAAFAEIVAELAESGKVTRRGGSVNLTGYEAALSPKDDAMWVRVKPMIEQGFTKPPVVHDMAKTLSLNPKAVERMLVRGAKLGLVYQVAANRFFTSDAVLELAELAETVAAAKPNGRFGARDFRDASGIGRNLTIEVLEYFDRLGLTWRDGDERFIRKPVSEVFAALSG